MASFVSILLELGVPFEAGALRGLAALASGAFTSGAFTSAIFDVFAASPVFARPPTLTGKAKHKDSLGLLARDQPATVCPAKDRDYLAMFHTFPSPTRPRTLYSAVLLLC